MRSRVLKDFLSKPITKKVLKYKDPTIAYQLGVYVGEHIINRYLPTLSIDYIQTNNNISVTCAEGDEYRRLNDIWFNKKRDDSSAEWDALKKHEKMLNDKYLPKTLECHIPFLCVNENDMEEFKNGLIEALWDCDCCNYKIGVDDIIIVKEKIVLTR
jgi:hypothetical protein